MIQSICERHHESASLTLLLYNMGKNMLKYFASRHDTYTVFNASWLIKEMCLVYMKLIV